MDYLFYIAIWLGIGLLSSIILVIIFYYHGTDFRISTIPYFIFGVIAGPIMAIATLKELSDVLKLYPNWDYILIKGKKK